VVDCIWNKPYLIVRTVLRYRKCGDAVKRLAIGLAYFVILYASIKIVIIESMEEITMLGFAVGLYSAIVTFVGAVSLYGFLFYSEEVITKTSVSSDEPIGAQIKKLIIILTTMSYFILGILGITMLNMYFGLTVLTLCLMPFLLIQQKGCYHMNKIFALLLVLIVMPCAVFGADSIYTWGYGEQAHSILRSVQMMTAGGSDYTLRLAAAFGLFAFAFKIMVMGKDNTLQEITKYMLIMAVVGYMFWISKKEYLIEDQVDGYTSPSALELPVGVGTTLSIFSGIEKSFGEGMEKYFSTPTTIGLMKNGLGFQMNVHLGSSIVNIHKAEVARSFNEYVGNCVMPAITSGSIDSNKLLNSDDLINDLRVNNSLLTNIYDANNNPTTIECSLAWDQISSDVQGDYPFMLATVGAITGSGSSATFGTDVGQVFKTMYGNASNSAQNGIIQSAIRNGLSQGIQSAALATGGDAGNLAISKAMTDSSLRSGWSQAGIAAQKTLPMQKAVFTLVLMGLIVFLALMSMVFVTMQYVKSIFMLLAVLVMWNPIAAILNFLISMQMDKTAQQVLAATGGSVQYPTYITSNLISQSAADYMAFLGFFGTLIPMFAYMLVKGGDSIASHMYSSIASGMSVAARSGMGAQALGNIQTGSASGSTRQFSNDTSGSVSQHINHGDGSATHATTGKNGFETTASGSDGTTVGKTSGTPGGNAFQTDVAKGNVATSSMGGNIQTGKFTSLSDASSGTALAKVQEKAIAENNQQTNQYRESEMKAFANAVENVQGRSEKLSVLQKMGLSEKDSDTILKGIETVKGGSTNLNYGTGAGSGHTNTTSTGTTATASVGGGGTAGSQNTEKNVQKTVTNGESKDIPTGRFPEDGSTHTKNEKVASSQGRRQGKGKNVGGSISANANVAGTVNVSDATSTNDNSNIAVTAGENSSYANKNTSSVSNVIEGSKDLQKALDRAATATHSNKSSTTDSHVREASDMLAHSLSVGEALKNTKTETGASGRNLMVPAINDYAERMGIKDQEALTSRLKYLDNLYSKGGKDDEWEKSLKNAIVKTSGIDPEASNVDTTKLTQGAANVADEVKAMPTNVAKDFYNVGSTLSPETKKEYNSLYDAAASQFDKPGTSPRVTQGQMEAMTEVGTAVQNQQSAAIVDYHNKTSMNDMAWYERAAMSVMETIYPEDIEKLKHSGPNAQNFKDGTGAYAPQTNFSELTQAAQDRLVDNGISGAKNGIHRLSDVFK